ncbi:MAG TPA: TonB-dependent receptor [Candidatus Angelobacter sp.]|jgi:TonB-dependent receptor
MQQPHFFSSLVLKSCIGLALALSVSAMFAQSRGGISGRVTDSSGAVLQGARVELQPQGIIAVTNQLGEFTFTNVPPGDYTVIISYVGFESSSKNVTVGASSRPAVNVSLAVKSKNEEVIVTAPRVHGEAEAINRTRDADNILQVIPADVITSLPNANIADALGRLPSVTLERDEGEGKYVQIRGTEPRLSNVTIDGVNVPSPESGVRQIKLDTVASDLVESIEVNKTLQANQDGDGIGGSVNLKTKTAGDVPSLSLYGLGGYTPIIGGRGVDQFGGTVGHRFGANKKFGILFGGTYDWNGRGINDIEPSPTTSSLAPHYDSLDLRDYQYYRTRWGLAGSTDYKLGEGSDIHLRGLYSTFRNWGQKYVYTLNDGDVPQASQDWRRPDFAIGSLVLGGKKVFGSSWLNWDTSIARSRSLNGSGSANYAWAGPDISGNCSNEPANNTSVYRPAFSAGCFTPGAADATDIRNYNLTKFELPPTGLSAQLNLQASASFAKAYHLGSHYGTFEFGGKIRNAHKFDDTQTLTADFRGLPAPVPAAQFLGTFTDSNYYDGTYHFTNTPDYTKVRSFAMASGLITSSGVNSANYNLIERVSAGYLMNTLDLTHRVRVVAGVRFEATHVATMSFNPGTSDSDPLKNTVSIPGGSDYLDVLPSVSVRFGLTKDSALRAVFSRGLARPDPQDIAQSSSTLDTTQTPNVIALGNPNLKAEHSNNYDLLFEQYLNPVGVIQAGFFYKQLGDPIVNGLFAESPSLFANQAPTSPFVLVSQVQNIGSAHLWGFELGYSQRLSRLPGVMKGLGISANYSYTNSETSGLQPLLRDDHPALLRQAPNTWNISPTFDTKRFSMRVGMTYNDAMIFAYQFQNLQPGTTGIVPIDPADLPPGGAKGPGGDNYLYAHYQIDAQASFKLRHNFSVYGYGLNLNNEVFGFYNGSPQYVVQREYYKPTYAGGVRYTFNGEK